MVMMRGIKEALLQVRIIVIGLISAALLVFVVLGFRGGGETETAWVATQDGVIGEALSATKPKAAAIPPEAKPESSITDPLGLEEARLATPIEAGTVLTSRHLQGSEVSRTLDNKEAMISLTLPTAITQGIEPGDYIDIWGKHAACSDVYCDPEILSQGTKVVDLKQTQEGGLVEDDTGRLTIILSKDNVGPVLSAAQSGSINLAVRPPSAN